MKFHVVTYASESFARCAKVLGIISLQRGFEGFEVFKYEDLTLQFRELNSKTLDLQRGAGYWVWKPEIILQKCSTLNKDEFVFYLDAGSLPTQPKKFFEDQLDPSRINVWMLPGHKISEWVDHKVLSSLDFPSNLYENPMVWAGAISFQPTFESVNVMTEWKNLCEVPEFLRPDSFEGYEKSKEIRWHRHDQSLLSILVALHPQLFNIVNSYKPHELNLTFNRHRNLKIRQIQFTLSFPFVRRIRQEIVNRLPITLRRFLRKKLANYQKNSLTTAESNSIAEIF